VSATIGKIRPLWSLLRNRIEKHLAGKAIDQLEAEQFGAFAQGVVATKNSESGESLVS
jgi:hypothetical protein